jgi:hypothetical protein
MSSGLQQDKYDVISPLVTIRVMLWLILKCYICYTTKFHFEIMSTALKCYKRITCIWHTFVFYFLFVRFFTVALLLRTWMEFTSVKKYVACVEPAARGNGVLAP